MQSIIVKSGDKNCKVYDMSGHGGVRDSHRTLAPARCLTPDDRSMYVDRPFIFAGGFLNMRRCI